MRSYTVILGDSLSEISKKFFGDFSQVDAIASLNSITDKDVIFPGQVLKIPDAAAAGSASAGGDRSSSSSWMPWLILLAVGAGGYIAYEQYKASKKRKRS